jgi:DNA-binding NarL/FixJ family response regulator
MPTHIKSVDAPQEILIPRTCCKCGEEFRGSGQTRVCPGCRKTKPSSWAAGIAARTASNHLFPREKQVTGLVARGLSNKAIAFELKLSEGTIKAYLFCIYRKVKVTNRTELAIWSLSREKEPSKSR